MQKQAINNDDFLNNMIRSDSAFIKLKERMAIIDWMQYISFKQKLQRTTCY